MPIADVVAAPGFEPSVDSRREGSAFFSTVFILEKTFPIPFFSFSFSLSFGTDGPPCAGELMLAVIVVVLCYVVRLLSEASSPLCWEGADMRRGSNESMSASMKAGRSKQVPTQI